MSQHGLSSSINICSIYLLTEHRRHQILPGLVRDGDIGFKGIVVFVTGEGHHDLGRHPLFKGVDHKGSSCSMRPYHVTKGLGHNHSINSVPLHLGHLAGDSRILAIIHRQCTWTTALRDTFVYTAHRKQTSAGDYPKECTHNRV